MQSPIEQVTMKLPHSQKNNHNQNARTPIASLVRIDPVVRTRAVAKSASVASPASACGTQEPYSNGVHAQ